MTDLIPPVPPRSGSDTWDLIENALRELADRRGRRAGAPLTAITLLARQPRGLPRCQAR